MMQFVWFAIVAVIVIGVILLVLQQRGAISGSGSSRQLPLVERTIFTMEVGDIVQYLDTDWVVEGRLTYDVGDYEWYEYMLQDGDRISWLSVDEDDRVEVALLEPKERLEVGKTPPEQLVYEGETYHCVESGMASMSRTGTTLRRMAERCRYFDYEGPGDRVLSVEDWNGDIQVTAGWRINPRMLTILPGSGNRVYGS
jgi:hypothetical protein